MRICVLLHRKWFNEFNVDCLTCPYDSLKLELQVLYAQCQHDLKMASMIR